MKKTLLICMFTMTAFAELSVERLVARQDWPWSATVRAVYVLNGPSTENVDVQLVVSNGTDVFEIPFSELSGDIRSAAAGRELSLSWDSSASATVSAGWLAANKDALAFSLKLTPTWPKYLVLNLSEGAEAATWPVTALSERPGCGWTDAYKTTNLVLRHVRVYGGTTFTCGSPVTEWGHPVRADGTPRGENEATVTLTNDFYIGVFELTEKQYEQIVGTAAFTATKPTFPKSTSWAMLRGTLGYTGDTSYNKAWPHTTSVQEGSLVDKLQTKVAFGGLVPTGWKFELPTAAQWEYACRAGSTGPWGNGAGFALYTDSNGRLQDPSANAMAWHNYNSGGSSHAVGGKVPNPWDLYDMHGNVSEMCIDFHGGGSGTMAGTEPKGAAVYNQAYVGYRVVRGGNYNSAAIGINSYWAQDSCPTNYNGTIAMIRAAVFDRYTNISTADNRIGTRLAIWYVK